MGVTPEDVKKIAILARLIIPDDEVEKYRENLNEILNYVEKLNEIDTDGVEPTTAVHTSRDPMRPDCVKASLPVDKVMENAPGHEHGFFRVPKVISGGETT